MGPKEVRCPVTQLLWIGAIGFLTGATSLYAAGQDATPAAQVPPNPVLSQRPAPPPKSPLVPEGRIKLDVMVSDAAGHPVPGLEPWDFKIVDNNQPRKVMSFRAYDGVQVKPDPPVQTILVLDTVNLPFSEVAIVRQQVEAFLRQNGGKLALPTTLILLSDKGAQVQPRPSVDGNAIASVVNGIKGSVRMLDSAMGGEGLLERFQLSVRNITAIAESEARRPGRKLLIWVGPGWPLLNRSDLGYSGMYQKQWFASIVELSRALREAQISVYSVAPATDSNAYTFVYQSFLKGVPTYQQADTGNLALKVLAMQTGGLALGPDNNLVGQLNQCVAEASAYYRISFDPPAAARGDEYHDLKVVVDKPGTVVRTTTGYYNEPAETNPAAK